MMRGPISLKRFVLLALMATVMFSVGPRSAVAQGRAMTEGKGTTLVKSKENSKGMNSWLRILRERLGGKSAQDDSDKATGTGTVKWYDKVDNPTALQPDVPTNLVKGGFEPTRYESLEQKHWLPVRPLLVKDNLSPEELSVLSLTGLTGDLNTLVKIIEDINYLILDLKALPALSKALAADMDVDMTSITNELLKAIKAIRPVVLTQLGVVKQEKSGLLKVALPSYQDRETVALPAYQDYHAIAIPQFSLSKAIRPLLTKEFLEPAEQNVLRMHLQLSKLKAIRVLLTQLTGKAYGSVALVKSVPGDLVTDGMSNLAKSLTVVIDDVELLTGKTDDFLSIAIPKFSRELKAIRQ